MSDRTVTVTMKLDDKVSGGLDKVSGKIKDTGDKSETAKGSVGGFATNLGKISTLVQGGASLWGLNQFVGVLEDINAEGTRATQIEAVFDALNREDAATTLERLREATGGIVEDVTLMEGANLMKQMGLADGGEELSKMTEMAIKLGRAMGHDVNRSLDDFTKMLANQSILRLDTFGISSGKVRDRMKELKDEFPDMTKEMRFMTATMEQGEAALERLGAAAEVGETSIARIGTRLENIKTDRLQEVATGLEAGALAIETTAAMFEEDNLLSDANVITDIFGGQYKDALQDAEKLTEYIDHRKELWDREGEAIQNVGKQLGFTNDELKSIFFSGEVRGEFVFESEEMAHLDDTAESLDRVKEAYIAIKNIESGASQSTAFWEGALENISAFNTQLDEAKTGFSGFLNEFGETKAETVLEDMQAIRDTMSEMMGGEGDELLTEAEFARYAALDDEMQSLLSEAEGLAELDLISKDDIKSAEDMAKEVGKMTEDAQKMAEAIDKMNLGELLGRGDGGVLGEMGDDILARLGERGMSDEGVANIESRMALATGEETQFGQYYEQDLTDLVAMIGEEKGTDEMILAMQNIEAAIKEGRLMGLSDEQMIDYVGASTGYGVTSTFDEARGVETQSLTELGDGATAFGELDLEPMAEATTTISENMTTADETMSQLGGYAEDVNTMGENMTIASEETLGVSNEVDTLQGKLDALASKTYNVKINLNVAGAGAELLDLIGGAVKDNGGSVPGADNRSSGGSGPF